MKKCKKTVDFIKDLYKKDFVALHEPVFIGNEKKYVNDCIDSTFVSSVGKYVDKVEEFISNYVGSNFAIAVVNGTSALHIALFVLGVDNDSEVITQSVSFVATANAISYTGAKPIFIDIDKDSLGISPKSLKKFLESNCYIEDNKCINKQTNKIIKACVPMHTFGNPCRIDEIKEICDKWNIYLVEDAAESLGSKYKDKFTGTFGKVGVYSFNGNKIVTAGGGGVVVTDDEKIAKRIKHLTTTAKKPHKWEYFHNEIGFNYRMPNINAALLLAQLEKLDDFIKIKRELHNKYKNFFNKLNIEMVDEIENARSNYWLNAILVENKEEWLECLNNNKIMARPLWNLLNELPMYKNCQTDELKNSYEMYNKVINIPSGVVF
ncbi:LegC family aminotransferase [Caminibacter mediatlanticus]|uniref:GDP-perosamine synthase n=1 Tax=Caminibacter mediatlanticus TB-2 TaxID=391592 RepID=A0AAI9F229_9BACT|nr:LegC family aminotransferase [Caminibacter mediatlanticus]EDM23166.1 DegT/DnrJ/EryC1/StrS aminotransferase [Caminibacter mediatlanticus TB-2]